jgi:hypothetical protein
VLILTRERALWTDIIEQWVPVLNVISFSGEWPRPAPHHHLQRLGCSLLSLSTLKGLPS